MSGVITIALIANPVCISCIKTSTMTDVNLKLPSVITMAIWTQYCPAEGICYTWIAFRILQL